MKKDIFLLILSLMLMSCGDDLNSLTVINNSNHNIIFALGDENIIEYSDLTIKVNSLSSFIYYSIEPGSVWLYYASMEEEKVYVEYLGDITTKDEIEFTIDTTFEDIEPYVPNDEYYIQYEVNSNTIYSGREIDVRIATESNKITKYTIGKGYWTTTIGPVEKGFNATLNAELQGTDSHFSISAYISVSKNNSPFALKASDISSSNRESAQVTYIIDY